MKIERAKELLNNLLDNLKTCFTTKEVIGLLICDYGFTANELIEDFGFLKSDVEEAIGEKAKETITVSVYRDTVDPGFNGNDNIAEIEVDRDELFKFFKMFALSSFKGDDKTVSEEGLFEEWLDEYTCDDTEGLYSFIGGRSSGALKSYFVALYDEKWKRFREQAVKDGSIDPDQTANSLFDDSGNADEIVGYYIEHYGDDALDTWMQNLKFYQESEKDGREAYEEQDKEVTRILNNLFAAKREQMTEEEIAREIGE